MSWRTEDSYIYTLGAFHYGMKELLCVMLWYVRRAHVIQYAVILLIPFFAVVVI